MTGGRGLEPVSAKVSAGQRLTDDDVGALASTSDIISLGMLAEDARRRRHGSRATFLRVAHIAAGEGAATEPLPVDAGEVRLTGEVATLAEAVAAAHAVAGRAGRTPVSAFSVNQLASLAANDRMPLDRALVRLKEAGVASVAELLIDSPLDVARALEAAATAGLSVSCATFERAGDDWLVQVRDFLEQQRGRPLVRALAPLPRRVDPAAPTTGYEDLRRVALARLLADSVETVQVGWTLYGPKLAQVSLVFGADDLDDVPAVQVGAPGVRRTTIEEVRRNIRAAGLVPVERNGRWETER